MLVEWKRSNQIIKVSVCSRSFNLGFGGNHVLCRGKETLLFKRTGINNSGKLKHPDLDGPGYPDLMRYWKLSRNGHGEYL